MTTLRRLARWLAFILCLALVHAQSLPWILAFGRPIAGKALPEYLARPQKVAEWFGQGEKIRRHRELAQGLIPLRWILGGAAVLSLYPGWAWPGVIAGGFSFAAAQYVDDAMETTPFHQSAYGLSRTWNLGFALALISLLRMAAHFGKGLGRAKKSGKRKPK